MVAMRSRIIHQLVVLKNNNISLVLSVMSDLLQGMAYAGKLVSDHVCWWVYVGRWVSDVCRRWMVDMWVCGYVGRWF